jgi:alkylation response protein AidB-like acyl-CoA dehydrogenase
VVKVYGSELYMEAFDLMLEIVGAAASVEDGSPGAVLRGQIQADIRSQHVLTFGGGTNEMQRGLIAIFALGMPGSPR